MSQAVAVLHRDTIIEKVAQGVRVSTLAQALGVSHQAISKYLKQDPDYLEALEAGLEARLDQAEISIEEAADNVAVARARARHQAATWRCEREANGRWGVKSHVTVEHVGDLAEKLRRARERVIEHDPEQITHEVAKSLTDKASQCPSLGTVSDSGSDK